MKNIQRSIPAYLVAFPIATLLTFGSAQADDFAGPYYGEVLRVIDGDNFEAKVDIWPTVSATVSVRIKGIDAPELFRPSCPQEKLGAMEARDDLESLLPPGTLVRLEEVQADDFSGRVVAVAYRQGPDRGRTLVELLLNRGNVVAWEPGQADVDWCSQ